MNTQDDSSLDRQIVRLLDDELNEAEKAELVGKLLDNPAGNRRLREYSALDKQCRESLDWMLSQPSAVRPKPVWRRWVAAAVLLLVIGLLAFWWSRPTLDQLSPGGPDGNFATGPKADAVARRPQRRPTKRPTSNGLTRREWRQIETTDSVPIHILNNKESSRLCLFHFYLIRETKRIVPPSGNSEWSMWPGDDTMNDVQNKEARNA